MPKRKTKTQTKTRGPIFTKTQNNRKTQAGPRENKNRSTAETKREINNQDARNSSKSEFYQEKSRKRINRLKHRGFILTREMRNTWVGAETGTRHR